MTSCRCSIKEVVPYVELLNRGLPSGCDVFEADNFNGARQATEFLIKLGLHSHTVQRISATYVQARVQFRKRKLAWRKSGGVRRSLGWVPFNTGHARWRNGQVHFNGTAYGVWDSYGLAGYTLRSGSFSEDSRGRWYFNVTVEIEIRKSAVKSAIGIDLGCKEAATTSDGEVLKGRWFRVDEPALAKAQRAGKKRQTKKILARIRNRRRDATHKFTTALVNRSGAVFVGNVSSKAMVKTNMAKSALDAGWSRLKITLEYKCAGAGVIYQEVNEAPWLINRGHTSLSGSLFCMRCTQRTERSERSRNKRPAQGDGAVSSVEARTIAMSTRPATLSLWDFRALQKEPANE